MSTFNASLELDQLAVEIQVFMPCGCILHTLHTHHVPHVVFTSSAPAQ